MNAGVELVSQKPNNDAKNIGARFRSARSLVPNLNRKSFCERYDINRYTMQSWENGLHVSKGKNVEKFIEALWHEGIYCTSEWLFEGTGEPARQINGSPTKISSFDQTIEEPEQKFLRLIETLKQAHKQIAEDLVDVLVDDDVMAPKFMKGDIVMGIGVGKERFRLHQKYCIIELTPLRRIVRKVLVTKENLVLLALDERVETMTLRQNVNVYEIIWHWLTQSAHQ